MAEVYCEACEEIRQTAPEFVVNGLNDDMCTSLANDTGLIASNGNNDCNDLHDINDCLIGNMVAEVELYDSCDWKEYMQNYVSNAWTLYKAMICAMCGMWTNIHSLWDEINGLKQRVSSLESRMSAVENRVTTVENRVTDVENRVTTVENRVTTVENRITTVENRVTDVEQSIEDIWECLNS